MNSSKPTPLAHPESSSPWQVTSSVARRFMRPARGYVAGALVANLAAALFEGSTLGLLALALYLLSAPAESSAPGSMEFLVRALDRLQMPSDPQTLFLTLILFAVLAQMARSLLQFTGQFCTAHVQAQVQADARIQIFDRIMSLPFPRVSTYRLGDLTYYLSQADHLNEMFAQLNLLVRSVLLVIVYGIVLVWISWPLSLVAGLAYWMLSRILQRVILEVGRHARQFTTYAAALSQRATEFIQAVRLIHTFSMQNQVKRTVNQIVRKGMTSNRRAIVWGSTMEPTMDILTVAGAAAFLIGGYFVLGGKNAAALPSLLAFLAALHRMTPRLGSIHSSLAALAGLAPHIARVAEVLNEKVAEGNSIGQRPFDGLRQQIEFRNVSLRYQQEGTAAVEHLSFRIPRGSFTALVGPSGGGKSTVADLLLTLYQPTGGQILVDAEDLKGFLPSSWRDRIGVVSQDTFLFHDTLKANIAFGKPNATWAEITTAAKAAHADAFISKLPEGYETLAGDRGYRLSGGERQRVALARALIRQPDLLILDEAMSALDSESERFIQLALEEQRGQKTLLVIAHRLSTIARADQILVLDQGRLVESGTHEQLLQKEGVYARLWRLQSEKDHGLAEETLKKQAVNV